MYSVLLVSNQFLTRSTLKKIIEKNEKFSIFEETHSPKEAIELVKNNNIDLVFSDFLLPGISGVDFINKAEEANKDTKVFLLTSPHDLVFEENANVNLSQIILKPLTFEKVNEKLIRYDNKSHSSSQKDFISEMEKSINMNDFLEIYEYLTEQISKFDFENKDVEVRNQIKDNLINYGNRIINLNSLVEETEVIDRDFPLKDVMVRDERLCNIWVFKIVDYYFKKKSITKYPILKDICDYIDNNLDKNISLKDVVKECNISQGYLSRLFKNEYNLTVVNYIHLKKINLAKEYILLENSSVLDIAFNLGYNEYGYFSKVFKKYEKMTVEQFRKAR